MTTGTMIATDQNGSHTNKNPSSYLNLVKGLTKEDIKDAFPEVGSIDLNNSSTTANGTLAKDSNEEVLEGHDEEQIRLMDEVCIVLDWNDEPVGVASKKVCHLMPNINKGLLHRAFSVFLFNRENKLLLQQRADEKITFPGMWTNTCCSHPLGISSELGLDNQGESDLSASVLGVKSAAQRKLDQELGIAQDFVPIDKFQFLTRIHYVAPSDGMWGEHEIDYILVVKSDPTLHENPNEVKDTKYVSADELREMFKDDSLTFTPWFKLICENYLFSWWKNIEKIHEFENDKIDRLI